MTCDMRGLKAERLAISAREMFDDVKFRDFARNSMLQKNSTYENSWAREKPKSPNIR